MDWKSLVHTVSMVEGMIIEFQGCICRRGDDGSRDVFHLFGHENFGFNHGANFQDIIIGPERRLGFPYNLWTFLIHPHSLKSVLDCLIWPFFCSMRLDGPFQFSASTKRRNMAEKSVGADRWTMRDRRTGISPWMVVWSWVLRLKGLASGQSCKVLSALGKWKD